MKTLSILLICLLPLTALAQSPISTRISSGLDVGAGFRKNQISPSLSYYQLISVTRAKFLSVGWMATFRTFYASDVNYLTAPANLSRGKTGFNALGAPLIARNLDTLTMASASGTSLNLGVRAELHLGFLDIGASADILGITLGRNRIGQYRSSTGSFMGTSRAGADSVQRFSGGNVNQSAKPTIANLQLLGDNSIGTLATEVYVRVRVNQRYGIKAGYQWLRTEYTASVTNTVDGNNRFKSQSGLTYVAVTIPFFK